MASLGWAASLYPRGDRQIDKKDAAVFRCTLSGQSLHRWLEIPAWMFDRVVSANWRIMIAPRVDLAALGARASLLQDTDPPSQIC
ncbi:hypothetical protein [Mesorhizobium sp. M0199]|uniref:hypothetical protein n=1 Tax=Mesorhizobium sp. M0199 TaxID=2956911 RepID=UPI00333D1D36